MADPGWQTEIIRSSNREAEEIGVTHESTHQGLRACRADVWRHRDPVQRADQGGQWDIEKAQESY